MDVFEYVYFTCDFSGNVINSEIQGLIKSKS